MHGGSLCLCKYCREKLLRETIFLLWTSFFTIISPLRLVSPHTFISFQQGVPTIGWLGLSPHLIGDERQEFFFISGFWAGNSVEVSRDSFPPYTGEMGHLRPKGMLFLTLCFISLYHTCLFFFFFFFFYFYFYFFLQL